MDSLTCAPGPDSRHVRAADGRVLEVPAGWELLPPGDAGLTRRVKAAGPAWTVIEKVGRKNFSRGVWAPAPNISSARTALEEERASPEYARKRAGDVRRRETAHVQYVADFTAEVRVFLRFSRMWQVLEEGLALAVAAHATPVGSGTVARTKRIEIDRRAEAAVIAWLRHSTTGYDSMKVARVKGARRAVRRELASISRALLDQHRTDRAHGPVSCPLCRALATATESKAS